MARVRTRSAEARTRSRARRARLTGRQPAPISQLLATSCGSNARVPHTVRVMVMVWFLSQPVPAATKTAEKTWATTEHSRAMPAASVGIALGVMCVKNTAPAVRRWRRPTHNGFGCRVLVEQTDGAPGVRLPPGPDVDGPGTARAGDVDVRVEVRCGLARAAGVPTRLGQRLAGLESGQLVPPRTDRVAPGLALGRRPAQPPRGVRRGLEQAGAQVQPVHESGTEVGGHGRDRRGWVLAACRGGAGHAGTPRRATAGNPARGRPRRSATGCRVRPPRAHGGRP